MKGFAGIILAVVGCASVSGAAYAATASGQAPDTFDKCTYNGNGIAGITQARSCASVSAAGSAPYGQVAQNSAAIGNGYQSDTTQGSGTTSSRDNGWTNTASAASNTGVVSVATASLNDATLHGFIQNGRTPYASAGYINTRISDIIYFTNTSGAPISIDFGYSFDGRFSTGLSSQDPYTDGSVFLALNQPSSFYGPIHFTNSGRQIGSSSTSSFDALTSTLTHSTYEFAPEDYSYTGRYNAATGDVYGNFLTSILIPVGSSDLGFALTMSLDCRALGVTCDFGHTGKFGIGALPTGLTYTSQSGVLFAGTPAAVPEPATWALMILGFGGIGATLRQQRPERRIRRA